jgi:short-subunit dehydrogenase
MTRLAVPYLQKSDDPRVITTTSLGGIQPLRETPIYTAAKFGLRGAMLSFALDEELHGIKVGTVAPTATDTQMLRQEALDDGNVLNFIDTPQTALDVARTFLRVLEKPQLEAYPKTSDSILTRLAMLFPNLQPRVLPFFERKGRRGMRRYIEDLRKRGLVQEQNGKLVLTPRPERDG